MTTESEILQRIAKAIRLAYIARGNAGRMTFFIRPAWLDCRQFQPSKESDHGQRTTTQDQRSKETQKETDSGHLRPPRFEPAAAIGGSRFVLCPIQDASQTAA